MPVPVRLRAADGYELAGTLFLSRAPRAAALVAGAMGVPRSYYADFAEFLAQQSMTALTLDYRGIAGSRRGEVRGMPARLRDWGELDLAAALGFLRASVPGVPLVWVGHSVGGQLLGLVDDAPLAGAVLVAAQSGHWRLWHGARRAGMLLFWHLVVPVTVALAGKLPGSLLGGGEDVPPGVAREWARWGRRRDYLMSHARQRGGSGFARHAFPIRSYAVADDGYAPRASVEALLAFFAAARTELRVVGPADLGVPRIGHFGFFRRRFAERLWTDVAAFLREAAARAPAP